MYAINPEVSSANEERNPIEEDIHFYVDNATPDEVSNVLRVLSVEEALTSYEIAEILASQYGFAMQHDHNYSPRRLYDLGIAFQDRQHSKVTYKLSQRGAKLQKIQAMNPTLAIDLLHYLHFTSYSGNTLDRKYLWSYRKCCEIIWAAQRIVPNQDLAGQVLNLMSGEFISLDWTGRVGARFDATAVGRIYTWLRALEPSPFQKSDKNLHPRLIQRFELAALALDDTYRSRQYHYGDAVLMDESLINQIAGVFIIDPRCCIDLLRLSASVVPFIKISDTLAGASINLTRPFSINDV
jgi:hypothetical protein